MKIIAPLTCFLLAASLSSCEKDKSLFASQGKMEGTFLVDYSKESIYEYDNDTTFYSSDLVIEITADAQYVYFDGHAMPINSNDQTVFTSEISSSSSGGGGGGGGGGSSSSSSSEISLVFSDNYSSVSIITSSNYSTDWSSNTINSTYSGERSEELVTASIQDPHSEKNGLWKINHTETIYSDYTLTNVLSENSYSDTSHIEFTSSKIKIGNESVYIDKFYSYYKYKHSYYVELVSERNVLLEGDNLTVSVVTHQYNNDTDEWEILSHEYQAEKL